MDNLPELRDIHIPEGVSVFPPAYGWWLILLILLLIVFLFKLFKEYRYRSKKRYALRLLNNIREDNAIDNAKEMSEILRRICVLKYPQATVIFGQKWVDFLKAHTSQNLDAKTSSLLINAPYIPSSTTKYNMDDAETLRRFCEQWIGENL